MSGKEIPKSDYNHQLNNILAKIIDGDGHKSDIEKAFHLIMAGANPDLRSSYYKYTILNKVIFLKDFDIFKKFVIEAKCSINIEDFLGKKPIEYAIRFSCPSIVKFLLENESDANETIYYPTQGKCNRLHILIGYESANSTNKDNAILIAQTLIAKGVDLLAKNGNGMIPLELAEKNLPQSEFTEFIKKETIKAFNKMDNNGKLNLEKPYLTELYLTEENTDLKKENADLKKENEDLKRKIANIKEKIQWNTDW